MSPGNTGAFIDPRGKVVALTIAHDRTSFYQQIDESAKEVLIGSGALCQDIPGQEALPSPHFKNREHFRPPEQFIDLTDLANQGFGQNRV